MTIKTSGRPLKALSIVRQSLTAQLACERFSRYLQSSRFPPYWATSFWIPPVRPRPARLIYGGPSDADNGLPLLCALHQRKKERREGEGCERHAAAEQGVRLPSASAVRRRPFLQGRFIYMGESYTPILVKSALPRGGARTHSLRIRAKQGREEGIKRTAALWPRVRTS